MSIQRWMTVVGVLGLVFGLAYLLVPAPLLAFFGIGTTPSLTFAARFFGGSTLGWGVLGLTARGVPGRAGLGAIAGSFAFSFAIGTVLAVWGTLAGAINVYGWVVAALFLLLTLVMGAYRFAGGGS
ncbi:MAG: hypothetical protein WBR18_05855 [Anaerolineales bacterium]